MHVAEKLIAPKSHVVCQVYEGDVVREPLTREQQDDNRLWRELGVLDFEKFHAGKPVPLFGAESGLAIARLLPVHIGRIISRPVDMFEGDNLVVTTGKSLLLDRLFALGAPPAAITHMGVGATAAAAVVGDTQLGSTPTLQVFDALPVRASLVVTSVTTYATGTANISWNEIAMFNGPTNGTSIMFNRIAPIGPFVKTSAVAIEATITTTQS